MRLRLRRQEKTGVEIAIVIGGGNIFRGAGLARAGMDRVTGDHMGMLATVMNALAIQDALEGQGCVSHARDVGAAQSTRSARTTFAGVPFGIWKKAGWSSLRQALATRSFTTDTAASLRAIEIGADVLLKATKVDGVYDSDPASNPDASEALSRQLPYDQVIADKLGVMDATAIVMCRDNNLPLRVFRPDPRQRACSGYDRRRSRYRRDGLTARKKGKQP